MATILLTGWRVGLQKIPLTLLLRELLNLPLHEAKANVDRLLEGQPNVDQPAGGRAVVLEVANEVAIDFFHRASSLGAIVRLSAPDSEAQTADRGVANPQQAA